MSIQFYRERGFLPWAMVNFLVLLGWATPESREIFSPEELREAFSLEGISPTNAVFDIRADDPKFFTDPKAVSINAHYLRTMSLETLTPHVQEHLEAAGLWKTEYAVGGGRHEWFLKIIDLIRQRFHYLSDFATLGRAYFEDDFTMDPKTLEKNLLKYPELKKCLPEAGGRLEKLDPFEPRTIEASLREYAAESGIKIGILANGLRAVLTGQMKGPGVVEILMALGPQTVGRRVGRVSMYFN